jgi:CRP/FNR family cyclic AMP-dependent transcriptional regulator
MRAILNHCKDIPVSDIPDGTLLLAEGQKTGRVYVLAQGRIEVLKGDTQITVLDEPGSLVGEMSLLLDIPHTATARTLGPCRIHVIEDAAAFFRANPELSWLVARLLANRLNAATTYLVDLKRQFAHYGDHLEMVGEVLETLLLQQERDFHPGSNRDRGLPQV